MLRELNHDNNVIIIPTAFRVDRIGRNVTPASKTNIISEKKCNLWVPLPSTIFKIMLLKRLKLSANSFVLALLRVGESSDADFYGE